MKQRDPNFFQTTVVLLLFFASGALGLIYEVVWSRMMMHVFGSTAIAVGTVLAAFMSGLAVGAWLFGPIADRSRNPLRLYAFLEFGIALAALASHLLLFRLAPAHQFLYELTGSAPAVFALVRFSVAFLLVMAPTVLMGATLPALTRYLLRRDSPIGVELSTLYAVNTLGAVTGVLLTGFVLIRAWGIHPPVYLAVAGNLLIGCVAWLASRYVMARKSEDRAVQEPERVPVSDEIPAGVRRLVLFGLCLSGFTSFAYEIFWTRSLVFVLGNSVYALSTMLSAFLAGIALGGWLARLLVTRCRDRVLVFGWIQVGIGLLSALALPTLFMIYDPQALGAQVQSMADTAAPLVLAAFGVSFLLMLVPATLIGATFPLAGQICVSGRATAGAGVGRAYAVNTLGNVLGALAPGVFLLAWLGIQKGVLAMAVLNVGVGLAVLFAQFARGGYHPAWRLALPAILVLATLVMTRAPLQFQFPSEGERDHFQTLYYREGPLATTKVYADPRSGEKYMSVDGIVIGGTGYTEFKQLLLAHLPKLLAEDYSTELSVGVGSAILLGESARHPGVREITAVEIEPGVVAGAALFEEENHGVLNDERLRIVQDDVGSFLRTTHERYQVVSADEKTADEFASNGFSYSREYYDLLRQHLAPDGLVAQWVPSTLPPSQYRLVLNTFLQSFPHVQLWYFLPAREQGPFNSVLIGSIEPVALDPQRIDRRLQENPAAFASLEAFGLTSAEALIPHFVADERTLREALAGEPVNGYEHPRYEFFPPWAYARDRQAQVRANHDFILELKRSAHPEFLARVEPGFSDGRRLQHTFAAEFRYLYAFRKFLAGVSIDEHYRLFDDALAVAPWNDSLRARIYAQYSYLAATQRDPSTRALMMQKARDLYKGDRSL